MDTKQTAAIVVFLLALGAWGNFSILPTLDDEVRDSNETFICDDVCNAPITWDWPEYACSQEGQTIRSALCGSGLYTYLYCYATYELIGFNYPGNCGCPNYCTNSTGNGQCMNNQCSCAPGFGGQDCSIVTMENTCRGRGHPTAIGGDTNQVTCQCYPGFALNDCGAPVGVLPPIDQVIEPNTQYADDEYGNDHPIFNETTIAQIHITTNQSFVDFFLDPANSQTKEYFPCDFWFYNGYVYQNFTDIGFRIKGGASRHFLKKNWKFSFNEYVQGQKIYGMSKLNLKSMEMDPGALREKTCIGLLYSMNAYVYRGSYAQLYINGMNMGMYIMLEEINKQFLQSRFGNDNGLLYKCVGDLSYLGADPDLYANCTAGDSMCYTPETDEAEDFSLLRDFIAVLNKTPEDEFEEAIQKIFDVDLFLRTFTVEVLTGNWDGIWDCNNYWLYYNPDVNVFQYFRQDLDVSFGTWDSIYSFNDINVYGWGNYNSRGYRLINRILNVDSFRNSFSNYMLEFVKVYYNFGSNLIPRVNTISYEIAPGIMQDKWRNMDFAWTYYETLGDVSNTIVRETSELWDFRRENMTSYSILDFMKIRVPTAIEQIMANETYYFYY